MATITPHPDTSLSSLSGLDNSQENYLTWLQQQSWPWISDILSGHCQCDHAPHAHYDVTWLDTGHQQTTLLQHAPGESPDGSDTCNNVHCQLSCSQDTMIKTISGVEGSVLLPLTVISAAWYQSCHVTGVQPWWRAFQQFTFIHHNN